VELDQLLHLEGRHDFPRHDAAVDHALGQRLGDLRHRHRNAVGAERLQRLAGEPGRRAQLEALEVVHGLDLLVRMDQAVVMRPDRDRVHLAEFLARMSLVELLHRPGVGHALAGGHEGQLEGFRGREAAGARAGERPDDVGDAVAGLVVELGRRAAELHRREDVDLDATAGLGLDLLGPGREQLGVPVRHRRQEVVHLQRHLRGLAPGDAGDGRRRNGGTGEFQQLAATKFHVHPPGSSRISGWPLRALMLGRP
jgi:hypothetical protein